MTILWIYNRPLDPEAGGTERITSLVARGLAQLGHRCMSILVFGPDGGFTYEGRPVDDVYTFLRYNQVDVVINQIAYSTELLDAFLDAGGSRWRAAGGHIISCLHFDPKTLSLRYFYSSALHKTVRDYINLAKTTALHPYYEYRRRKNEGETYNKIYDLSDFFVTLSPTHITYMQSVMKRREYSKLVAINNPLTFERIAKPEDISRKKHVMLVCGRMAEFHKRVSLALKAWKRLSEMGVAEHWELRIVGDGPDMHHYRDYVAKHELKRVVFCGQCSPQPHYDIAELLLVTSSAEGWGLVITEALQRGVVPVVMNSSSVYSEIVRDDYNGRLTPDGDLRAFVAAIATLISNEDTLREMQLNAIHSASRFSTAATMPKWQSLLSKL